MLFGMDVVWQGATVALFPNIRVECFIVQFFWILRVYADAESLQHLHANELVCLPRSNAPVTLHNKKRKLVPLASNATLFASYCLKSHPSCRLKSLPLVRLAARASVQHGNTIFERISPVLQNSAPSVCRTDMSCTQFAFSDCAPRDDRASDTMHGERSVELHIALLQRSPPTA
jgi:hypothetical protein